MNASNLGIQPKLTTVSHHYVVYEIPETWNFSHYKTAVPSRNPFLLSAPQGFSTDRGLGVFPAVSHSGILQVPFSLFATSLLSESEVHLSTTFAFTLRRFQQLSTITQKFLPECELMQLAEAIEMALSRHSGTSDLFFHRKSKPVHSFIVNLRRREVYIPFKEAGIVSKGAHRRAVRAISAPIDSNLAPYFVILKTNQSQHLGTDISTITMNDTIKDLVFSNYVSFLPEKFHVFCYYKSRIKVHVNQAMYSKICVIEPELYRITTEQLLQCSPTQYLQLFAGLTKRLLSLKQEGIIHGAIKCTHGLYKLDEHGNAIPTFIDFGSASCPKFSYIHTSMQNRFPNVPSGNTQGIFEDSWYSSSEAFALGSMFYEMIFGLKPEWEALLQPSRHISALSTETHTKDLWQKVSTCVYRLREDAVQTQNTALSTLYLVTAGLLEPRKNMRIPLEEAYERITQLLL